MKRDCPHCHSGKNTCTKFGFFKRKSDGRTLARFKCRSCLKTFSQASFQKCYWQKKRHLNPRIFELFCSGVSQRRIAQLLHVSRNTVVRKFIFLALQARENNMKLLLKSSLVEELQFDDLETFEHSKLKPLSVTLAVENKTRKILGFKVSQMPAKGLLAKASRKKYGFREDHRKKARELLFEEIKPKIHPRAYILSDQNPHYPESVRKYFPSAHHETTPGRRGCVTGQGELKEGGWDPLFSLNHTCAMLRANINRLFRRTWCTTKLPERLSHHIELYVYYHNTRIIKSSLTK